MSLPLHTRSTKVDTIRTRRGRTVPALQHLSRRAPRGEWLAVVRDICGLHAQLGASAELTLWARVDGLEPGAVERALWEEKTLVKTWAQRGTLHLLAADELPLWTAAQSRLKPRHHVGSWLRHHGLTREQADAMLAAIPEALDGPPLTREELAAEVARLTEIDGLADRLRGGFGDLLKPAAFRGELCFAPSDGRNVRFTRPDRWLRPQTAVDPDEAVRTITRRYLAAYGPATREVFARWFGMTSPAQAGRWLAAAGDVEQTREPAAVRLLPAFDQHVIAAARDLEHRERIYRPQGWLSPVLLADGAMTGVWSHQRRGGRIAVEIEPFAPVKPAVKRAAEGEAEALAAFLGGELELKWA